jgi:bifunctional DNA-binding transcriptional regulator/antitoxin component of YhaV-PrlF toxin-antitoxin module
MADFFRVKIAAKRQVTLPQMMLQQLGLEEGDELEFSVADGAIRAVRPYRTVPLDYFPPNVLRMIAQRTKEMEKGEDGSYVQLQDADAPSSAAYVPALSRKTRNIARRSRSMAESSS